MINQRRFVQCCVYALAVLTLTAALENHNGHVWTANKSELPSNVATIGTLLKPKITRTELKVSRSLNPEDMQTINVRSHNGGVATIIVKKRDGRLASTVPRTSVVFNDSDFVIPNPIQPSVDTSNSNSNNNNNNNNNILLKQGSFRFANDRPQDQQSIDLINSFITHVENVKPTARQVRYTNDAPIDVTQTRNDRDPVHISVASTQVTDTQQPHKVPAPVYINSEAVYVKDAEIAAAAATKRGRSLIEIDQDGIPTVHGIRVPDDEADLKKTWRNARVINGELVPYEQGYKPPRAEPATFDYGQLVYPKKIGEEAKNIGPFLKTDNFATTERPRGLGPFTVDDNLATTDGSDRGTFFQYAALRNDGVGPFTTVDNSRPANLKLLEYIRRINEAEGVRDYSRARATRYVDYQQGGQPQIQRRMLQSPGNPIYPTSSLYATAAKVPTGAAAATTAASRSPVLEYAHPELGVQAAAKVTLNEQEDEQEMARGKASLQSTPRSQKVQYYSKDIHSDRSPFAIEPAMQPQSEYNVADNRYPADQSINAGFSKYYSDREQYPYRNPATFPYNYGYLRKVKEQPFWMKITETMRDSLQNGMSSMQEMTRPVFEPIVEAGHKISSNLGFVKSSPSYDRAQEKLGVVLPATGGGSILIPALGLMAGGAALGLGAMAMGRFFDVNMLRRSGDPGGMPFNLDEQRALAAINRRPDNVYVVMDEGGEGGGAIADARRSRRNAANAIEVYEIINVQQQQTQQTQQTHRIRKRNVNGEHDVGALLQDVERDVLAADGVQLDEQIRHTDWTNTGCAKKVFCEVMVRQSSDNIALMEKKMGTMLAQLHPNVGDNLIDHLTEVSDAIRKRNCSEFICYHR